jgi:hypothetical protein
MKHLRCIAICIPLMLATLVASAADQALPQLALADQDGRAAPDWLPERPAPSIVLVVDPAKPQSQAALVRLQLQAHGGEGVLVLAIGSEQAFQAMRQRVGTLAGVRWYRDTSGTLMRTLQLPGLPAVLGITAERRIAWRAIGLPQDAGKAQSLVQSWLNRGDGGGRP